MSHSEKLSYYAQAKRPWQIANSSNREAENMKNFRPHDRDSLPRSYKPGQSVARVLNVCRYCHDSPLIAGTIETYALPGVRVLNLPVPYLSGVQGELLAERFVNQQLPVSFRELYFPGLLVARGVIDKRSSVEWLQQDQMLQLIRKLEGLAKLGSEEVRYEC